MALGNDSLYTYLLIKIATASRSKVFRSFSEDVKCFTARRELVSVKCLLRDGNGVIGSDFILQVN